MLYILLRDVQVCADNGITKIIATGLTALKIYFRKTNNLKTRNVEIYVFPNAFFHNNKN